MKLIFDVECYVNYFLVMFYNIDTGNTLYFEIHNDNWSSFDPEKVNRMITQHTIIGFNSENYDIPIIKAVLCGASNEKLKKISDDIIVRGRKYWEIDRHYNLPRLRIDHIDLCNIAPTFGTLKIYGGRANAPKMQDLPIDPSATISEQDAFDLRAYCQNDLELTYILYQKLLPAIELRRTISKQYKIDLMAKSDAQIAEAVFKHALTKAGVDVDKVKIKPGTVYKYKVPDFIQFESPEFNAALDNVRNAEFKISEKGSVLLPDSLNKKIKFAGAKYKMGIGGLHSCEKKQTIVPNDDEILMDKDVTSYYPMIILNQGLYPKHLTPAFKTVYRTIVARRIKAKEEGDKITDDIFKIIINSSFGKFGSRYSAMYSPDLLIQTTITGQLALMMLIERLETIGVQVCSANTDGIVIVHYKALSKQVDEVCFDWELDTGFSLKDDIFRSIYSRDVNNYLAVRPDNTCKGKGIFKLGGLSKNPSGTVVYRAVINRIVIGTSVSHYIRQCKDMTEFTCIRTVRGGAKFQDELIGKSIRWYYSTESDDCITYAKNGNKVPKTDGARPMMELRDIPNDLDYQWYINEANSILEDFGLC